VNSVCGSCLASAAMRVRQLIAGVGAVLDGSGIETGESEDQDREDDQCFHGLYLLLGC